MVEETRTSGESKGENDSKEEMMDKEEEDDENEETSNESERENDTIDKEDGEDEEQGDTADSGVEQRKGNEKLTGIELFVDMYKKNEIGCIISTINEEKCWDKFIEIAYELLRTVKRHEQPATHALRSRDLEAMGLPLDYVASREGNLFEALSTDPDRLALDAFLYGIAHQCHLASERSRQTNTTVSGEDIMKDLKNFNTEDFYLTDTHFMCVAGALRASLEVWRPKHEVFQIYSPCICQVMEGIGSVVHTVGQTIKDDSVYVLLETRMEKRPTRHHAKRKQSYRRTWNGENERVGCFDGIFVYRKDLETLNSRRWLCDTIINVLLRYYCKLAERKGGKLLNFAFTSYFQQRLLIKGALSNRPLDLSGCNIGAVKAFTPPNMHKLKYVLVAICDMVHWWLIVYEIASGNLNVLCSLGGRNEIVALNILRYFKHVREEQLWPEEIPPISAPIYANVARQTNGNDCGVFVCEFGRRITEGGEIGPALVEGRSVERRRQELKKTN
ncbi:sentrin-specific protease 2 [Paramuricea clavata]|uniref:Sentrin-specific protease 2 n=1 Tax=Paramuricea clavata TaxID=317549 RepID=A0A7D9LUJ1_PARCT|nr:sentrin-specific protease 2 [Paramuricea clavata]